ncbi:rRNA maturation RNase YbeY [Halobacteriovorax marinus]|uniref:Endoribonuclease YbeY n=1 Tax=Halobacteriovorax marinus TaxID=97084 RepID=A0A1Y5FAQ5_9BACT|nr:rRNA maturation RNase YbeY [Halobacteriovorax marinus]
MKNKTLNMDNFTFYISDTSREGRDVSNPKLKKYLNETVKVLAKFIKSKEIDPLVSKCQNYELDLTICGLKKIQSLNKNFRNKNKATDVLSFPGFEDLRDGAEDLFIFDENLHFGDIVICREVCLKQSVEFNINYEQEFVHLLVHGFLHLCGYDHEVSKAEEEIHFSLEEKLVKEIYENMGIKNARVY